MSFGGIAPLLSLHSSKVDSLIPLPARGPPRSNLEPLKMSNLQILILLQGSKRQSAVSLYTRTRTRIIRINDTNCSLIRYESILYESAVQSTRLCLKKKNCVLGLMACSLSFACVSNDLLPTLPTLSSLNLACWRQVDKFPLCKLTLCRRGR